MNTAYKYYCRAFQTGMRLALPILPYRSPRLLKSVSQVPGYIREQAPGRTMIITDKGCEAAGLLAMLTAVLVRAGQDYTVFDETVANPTTDIVEKARRLYIKQGCRSLIGLGGGSSMDCAKAVGARIARPDKQLGQMSGILKVGKKIPCLISIPTTAGTGSEATLAAVITDSQTRHKYAINDFPLIPSAAVLDPQLTRTLPKSLTATTGMDALTHAVEAYIGRSTTGQTRAWAVKAVRLIFANILQAYNDGDDMKARACMLHAAFYAGESFSQSYVGYVHAVAHSLGGQYDIAHGLANAVLLPIVLEAYDSTVWKKLHELAAAAGISSWQDSDARGAEKFIAAIRSLNQAMNIPDTLPGIREQDIPMLARYAAREANPLYPVPVLWDAQQLERFYYAVMEGDRS